ncbi:MAG: hypothetical protein KF896_06060, partial [Ignavibacteriae bacterium]|nr:hypothetical protein [Ignavibacteriota bacterium]
LLNFKQYAAFGGTTLDTLGVTRQGYIGKEKDVENNLGDHGVRKYDYETGRFNSIDPLWEKYYGWTPYQYCMNNPIWAKDWDGRDAVKIVDDVSKTVTVTAVYVYNTMYTDATDIQNANSFLNTQNYKVSDGEYKDYDVKFDLTAVPNISSSGAFNFKEDFSFMGTSIGNTYSVQDEFNWTDHNNNKRNFNPNNGQTTVGVTLDQSDIIMNKPFNNNRRTIHEMFHTFFFNKDNAPSGIGNYVPGTDMPNQDDINQLINNQNLEKK